MNKEKIKMMQLLDRLLRLIQNKDMYSENTF